MKSRYDGMFSKEEVDKANSEAIWTATCHLCKKELKGKVSELLNHKCDIDG